jgi:hypothetical protein
MKVDLSRESEIQHSVIGIYSTFGVEVRRFSEGRRTRISKGWPDLACFLPAKRLMWYHECKTLNGRQSPAQSLTQRLVESCGIDFVVGGIREAEAQLRKVGLIATP